MLAIKPLDPRLLRTARAARGFIASVVALALLGAVATVVFAWQLSSVIVAVFIGHESPTDSLESLTLAFLAGSAKALVLWLQELFSARAATLAKKQLRAAFFDSMCRLGPDWLKTKELATLNSLANAELDAIDAYFSKFLPQVVFAALVTPIFTVLIFWLDPLSGLALVLTLPLIPLFMIFIGWATQVVQKRQLEALHRLTGHFLEVVRGLTTLRIFSRARSQVKIIGEVSEQYRVKTMKVLRVSFLSGFALELAGSLSVALIAVSIGLRLVSGEITLATGLLVLLLAPEAYLPLRMVGANFHASSEGVSAAKSVLDIIDEAKSVPTEAIRQSEHSFANGRLTVIQGTSGAGKTTLLQSVRRSLGSSKVAWMPQSASLFQGTIRENIIGPDRGDNFETKALELAVGLAALDDLELSVHVGTDGKLLSGGQAQRVSLARAFYRALTNDSVTHILLDEPISSLDLKTAEIVVESLQKLARRGYAVVAVSHQTINSADEVRRVSANHA